MEGMGRLKSWGIGSVLRPPDPKSQPRVASIFLLGNEPSLGGLSRRSEPPSPAKTDAVADLDARAFNRIFERYLIHLFRDPEFDGAEEISVSKAIEETNLVGFVYFPIYLTSGMKVSDPVEERVLGDWLGLLEFDVRCAGRGEKADVCAATTFRLQIENAIDISWLGNECVDVFSEKLSEIGKELSLATAVRPTHESRTRLSSTQMPCRPPSSSQ